MNGMQFLLTVVTIGGVYALLALALNLKLGHGGLINFGIVAYFTAGAYAYVIIVQPPPTPLDTYKFGFELPMWVGFLGAGAAAVAFALVTGWPCLRLRGEYLALTTFAFAEVFGSLVTNGTAVTNGTLGFSGLAQPFDTMIIGEYYSWFLAGLTALAVAITFVLVQRLTRAPFGRALRAVRDDELAAGLAGKPVRRLRLQTFVLGALICGFAGAIYAWYTTLVSPELFTADVTFTVFIALIIGGIGSNVGAVAGAVVLIGFQEIVRGLATNPVISARAGAVQLALEGLLFIVILRLAPGGAVELLQRTRDRIRNGSGRAGRHPTGVLPATAADGGERG